jgi:hypothetical protein
MSLVRSSHLRSSSKRRIHLFELYFSRRPFDVVVVAAMWGTNSPHIFFVNKNAQDLYEPARRVNGVATIVSSSESEVEKSFDYAFCLAAKVISNNNAGVSSSSCSDNLTLDSFENVTKELPLFGNIVAKKWTTYPGFFAKGGLDIMTSFLLESTIDSKTNEFKKGVWNDDEASKPCKRIMDFCCGSGVIGYVLKNVVKKRLKMLSMLDCDSVTLVAAKKNLLLSSNDDDDAATISFSLSDGLPLKAMKKKCDLIFTNPPVHYGSKPDFSVLTDMFLRLENCLAKKKSPSSSSACFCVCQRYVPIEALLKRSRRDVKIAADVFAKNSRFVVWKLSIS